MNKISFIFVLYTKDFTVSKIIKTTNNNVGILEKINWIIYNIYIFSSSKIFWIIEIAKSYKTIYIDINEALDIKSNPFTNLNIKQ